MDKTGIAWTDATWNPIGGCTRISPGCQHCYAETMAGRFCGEGEYYHGLVTITPSGPRWTGEMKLHAARLDQPARWRKPRMVFVNSMSDLFHERVPFQWVDEIVLRMGQHPRHTYQVLTKRAQRMHRYLSERPFFAALPHIWWGVSVEDQQRADERVPWLLDTPAAVRFLSCEPLLEYVVLSDWLEKLDWVIVGGESGPGARPCHTDDIRDIVCDCRLARCPVFVKQLGANPMASGRDQLALIRMVDRKGANPAEWPEDLRVQQWPTGDGR